LVMVETSLSLLLENMRRSQQFPPQPIQFDVVRFAIGVLAGLPLSFDPGKQTRRLSSCLVVLSHSKAAFRKMGARVTDQATPGEEF
jgi:hypothetical protein